METECTARAGETGLCLCVSGRVSYGAFT